MDDLDEKKMSKIEELFETLKNKGIFYSYDKSITLEDMGCGIFIEHVLKYGDFDDIKTIIKAYGKEAVKDIWEKKVMADKRFIRTNLLIARVFFDMDVEADFFKDLGSERLKKLKMSAT